MKLLERLEYVMREKGWSADEWSLKAGLHRSHLNTTLQRLYKQPKATVRVPTLQKLAGAAGLPLEFFTADNEAPGAELVRIVPDSRYPSRAAAVGAARVLGWSPEAIRRVQAIDNLDRDPGQPYWLATLQAENSALAGTSPAPATLGDVKKHRRQRKTR